jgi:hypothetical protein
VANAANSYIKNNFSSITAVATPTTPALIRVSDLVAGGYLTAGFSTKNPSQQDTCVLVLEPTPNNLTALAVTEGGVTIDDLGLGRIASTIGGAGGAIYSTANTTVRGAMGGYSFAVGNFANANHLGAKCDGVTAGVVSLSAGHPMVALWFDDSNPNASTLYRDAVPGNPSLNTMNTPIIMGAGSVQTVDAVCPTDGALGRDATGGVVSCVSGKWKASGGSQYWQDQVLNIASLPVSNASALNQTRVVQTPNVGTGARAYTCNGAGTWQPLSVGNDGNLNVPGAVSSSTATIGTVNATRIEVGGASDVAASGSNGIMIRTVAVEGTSCPGGTVSNGMIAKNSTGTLLSCESGGWKKVAGSTFGGSYIFGYATKGSCSKYGLSGQCVSPNSKTGACSCATGFTASQISSTSEACQYEGGIMYTNGYNCNQ